MSKGLKAIGAVVSYALAIWTAPFGGAPFFVHLGNYLLLASALDVVSEALTPGKPRLRRTGQDIEYAGTVEPGRLIYGQMRVSGMNVIPPWTSGDKNQFLHQVLAVAAHRVQAINRVDFGDEEISSIGSVTGTVNDGKVGAGTFADKAWIRRYVGGNGQTVDFILNNAFPVEWDSDHQGIGIAYLALQYELDEEVYSHGKPEVTCIVQGKRCYDPREDTGGPGDDPDRVAFISYTTNPALCLADYLIDESVGLGEDPERIDWDSVVAAANICDEDVVIPPSASPSNTQKRYTCNVVLDVAGTEDERRENIRVIAQAMMGAALYRGGKWRIHAGTAGTSTFALTADDIAGEIEVRTEIPPNEKYNRVRGQFVDRDRKYQLSEFEPRINSSYETADDDVLPREVAFLACDNQYEAQRNALVMLKRSRRKRQVTGTFSMSAFQIRPFDVGTFTLSEIGWDEQPVRCMGWTFNQDGTVELVLVEELDTDWDDPAVGDYTVPSIAGAVTPGSYKPDEPQDFTATPVVDGILFQWKWPNVVQLPMGFNLYEASQSSPLPTFASATLIKSRIFADSYVLPKADTTTRRYWLTSFHRVSTNESDPIPGFGTGIQGKALSITTGYRLIIDRASQVKFLVDTGSGSATNTATVTAVDESAASTFAWTKDSGGSSKISVTAASSATTGFTATGLADGETAAATFTCTGTSSGASPGTATVKHTVTFIRDDNYGA